METLNDILKNDFKDENNQKEEYEYKHDNEKKENEQIEENYLKEENEQKNYQKEENDNYYENNDNKNVMKNNINNLSGLNYLLKNDNQTEINDLLDKNISIYNSYEENEKINSKEEEKHENNVEKKPEENEEANNKENYYNININNVKLIDVNDIISDKVYFQLNEEKYNENKDNNEINNEINEKNEKNEKNEDNEEYENKENKENKETQKENYEVKENNKINEDNEENEENKDKENTDNKDNNDNYENHEKYENKEKKSNNKKLIRINDIISNDLYNEDKNNENVEIEKEKKEDNELNEHNENINRKSEKDKENQDNNINNINNEKLIGINDIITNDIYNRLNEDKEKENNENTENNENKEITREEDIKDNYLENDKENLENQNLNQKEEKTNNSFEFENKDNKEDSPIFNETFEPKIQNNENYLKTLNDQIINKPNDNDNINNIKVNEEEKKQNDDEDQIHKKEENSLKKEELLKINIENIDNKKEILNQDNIEENKEEKKEEEKEEDKLEIINNNKTQEENEKDQNDNLKEKNSKSDLNEINDEINIKNKIIDNEEQKIKEKKEIIETINNNKEIIIIEENIDKTIDKNNENIHDNEEVNNKEEIRIRINLLENKNNENNINNNKKTGKKSNIKKKQVSDNVFSRLYNNKKKGTNIKKDENYNTNNTIKTKNNQKTESLNNNSSENNIKKEIKKKTTKNKNHQKKNTNQNNINSNILFQNFVNDSKNSEISKKLEQFKHPIIFDDTNYEYSFKPEINQKSIKICQKGFKKNNNSSKNKKTDYSYIENRRTNAPITNILYKDASNKNQRMENIYLNEKKNIKKEVNQSLISKNSVNLLLKKNELKLKQVVDKYSKNNDGQLSIINTIQCLWEMSILRELLKNYNQNIEEINLQTIKNIIENIVIKNTKATRIFVEIEFVEQFWIKINPYYENENNFIKKEDLYNCLKMLFSLDEHSEINKMIIIVEQCLKTINEKENNDENNNKTFNSLLRDKEYEKKEIWQISKFIRVFLELKKLSIKYENTKKDKIKEKIIKEREKELTFQPDFNATANYFRKKNNGDLLNTSINSNISNNTNKRKHNFNKLYEEFMLKKQMHEKALMILKENKEKRERRMYTDRPSINKHYKIKNRKKTPEIGCTRNEFLYNLNKDILNKRKERIMEKENEYNNKEIYPFRPNIGHNKKFLEEPKIKPKGSEEYIKRNKSVIQFRKRGINYYEPNKTKKVNISKIKHSDLNNNLVHVKEKEEKEEKEGEKEEKEEEKEEK